MQQDKEITLQNILDLTKRYFDQELAKIAKESQEKEKKRKQKIMIDVASKTFSDFIVKRYKKQ